MTENEKYNLRNVIRKDIDLWGICDLCGTIFLCDHPYRNQQDVCPECNSYNPIKNHSKILERLEILLSDDYEKMIPVYDDE